MEADELFDHALSSLPEAVGDAMREGRDTSDLVFVSFDGASELGKALVDTELKTTHPGQQVVVSMMVPPDVLVRVLSASSVDAATRVAVALWLETPVAVGHFRVVAIAADQIRAATVDGISELDDAPESSSLLN